jgi:hypothetical protein
LGKLFFEPLMYLGIAGHERTCATSPAVHFGRTRHGVSEPHVGGQTQVVVGAEANSLPAFELELSSLGARSGGAMAKQVLLGQTIQLAIDPIQRAVRSII